MMKNKRKTLIITMCALFAALISVFSQVQIPLPQIPINLALAAVYLAGVILGPAYGSLSVIVFVLLGIVGVPVFAGFRGGLDVITGATGGYIVGYITCAFLTGLIVKYTSDKIYVVAIAMFLGMVSCYVLGTIWFMTMSGTSLKAALTVCVLPFLPGDAVKIVLSSVVANRIRHSVEEVYELNPCRHKCIDNIF